MSEIAAIRQRIERECEAALRAMYAPRIVGPHDIIEHQFASLASQVMEAQEKLVDLVGKDETDTIMQALFKNDWRGVHGHETKKAHT